MKTERISNEFGLTSPSFRKLFSKNNCAISIEAQHASFFEL